MGMILRIASSRIVGQGDIVGRSGYFSLNLSANSVMRGRLDARRTLKSLVADLRDDIYSSTLKYASSSFSAELSSLIISRMIIPYSSRAIRGHTSTVWFRLWLEMITVA